MRNKPISLEITEAEDLKTLSQLSDEIKSLIFSKLSVDKRSLRNQEEKLFFKAKLELYCKLYKRCREKFIEVKKKTNDHSNYHKVPLLFEELIKDFSWEKTMKNLRPTKKKEPKSVDEDLFEDEDFVVETIEEVVEELQEEVTSEKVVPTLMQYKQHFSNELDYLFKQNIVKMKKLFFNRNDEEVKKAALELTLQEFLEKHKGLTTDTVLSGAYQEIRDKATVHKIAERVGDESESQPLQTHTPTIETHTGTEEQSEEIQKVIFLHAGNKVRGTIVDQTEKYFKIKGDDGTNYPSVKPEEVLGFVDDEFVTTTTTKVSVEQKVTTTTTVERKEVNTVAVSEGVLFKDFDKDEKHRIITSYWESGLQKCGEIKKKMTADGYNITHYDDVFYPFEKVRKEKSTK